MATNAKALQDYFAGLDAEEERVGEKYGISPDEVRQFEMQDVGEEMTPPSLIRPKTLASPVPRAAESLERMGRQLRAPVDMPEAVPSLSMPSGVPSKTTDFASLQKLMSPGELKAPEASPIPIRTAPSGSDAAKATASTLPTVTADKPAGKPDSSGKNGMPAPSSEGAGGDSSERDLYLARLAAQNAAGFGGMGAGKNIDMGIADTLGERLKQVQALRAKREEKQEEQAKAAGIASRLPALFPGFTPDQQKTFGDVLKATGDVGAALNLAKQFKSAQTDEEVQRLVNEQALQSAIVRYPQLATSFEALRPTLGKYAVKDFPAILEKAASGKATFEAKGAATRFMVDKQGRFNQLTPIEVDKQKLQNDRLRQQIDLDAKQFKLKEDEALKQTYKDDNEKATKLNDLAEKEKGFGGYVTLANDLAELEAAAPGFVTQGEAPEWLTSAQQAMGQNWPASTDPRVVKFLGAYGKLANAERHRLYGSAQTAGELKAFLQQLNDNPFSAGPDVLAMQMGGFAANVGRRATNTLTRYSNVFGSNVVDRVLGNEFRPLYDENGVFSSFKTPFQAVRASAEPTGARPPKPADKTGAKTLWNKKTGQWVRYTPEQEAKARAADAVED